MDTHRNFTHAEDDTLQHQTPQVGVAGEACWGIRTILKETHFRFASKASLKTTQSYVRLRSETERFAIWVDSFSATSGRLDDILRRSKELRTVVITLLYDLSKMICDGFTESQLRISLDGSLTDEVNELHILVEKLQHSLGLPSEPAEDGLPDDKENPPNLDELLDDLEFYIDSLMDLSPALDNPVTDPELEDSLSLPIEIFDVVSLAAQVFCRKIRDRFPSLDKLLVERFGQANADRILALKSLEEAPESEDDEGELLFSVSGPSRSGTRTSSQPSSVFDKHHLLSPIPEDAQSLTTLVSLASFKSSFSDAEKGRRRFPKFPETQSEAGLQCYVCSRWLPETTSRTAWKYVFCHVTMNDDLHGHRKHVFGDLKPYVCTHKTCKCKGQLWESSLAWVKHEASHGPQDLETLICPFCIARPASSDINNHYKHVAEHLREISLAALPVNMEDNNEDASTDENESVSSVDLSEDTLDRGHSVLDIDAAASPQEADADLP